MESTEEKYSTLDACIEDARRRTEDPHLLAIVEYLVSRARKAEAESARLQNEIALLRERLNRDAADRFGSDSESLNGEKLPDCKPDEAGGEAEPAPADGGSSSAELEAPQAEGGKSADELEDMADRLVKKARKCLKEAAELEEQEGRKKGRRPFSEQFQLIEMLSSLPEDLQVCSKCGGLLVEFGKRTATRLIFRPGSFVQVKEHIVRYICLRCSKIHPTKKLLKALKARIASCGGSAEVVKFLQDLVVKFGTVYIALASGHWCAT